MTRYPHLVVDGRAVEYRRVAGDAALPILVLLHEGLGCVALWRDFPERLAAISGCAVFVYSRFGYGGSAGEPTPWPLDYMQRHGRAMLPAVLDAAGIGPCILIGHSDGASIALVNAGAVRDPRVQGVIAMAPHVFTEAHGLDSIRAARSAFTEGDLRARLAKYHGANVACAFLGWCDSWLHPNFEFWNIEEYLESIQVPVMLIQGADDQYGTREQLYRIERRVTAPVESHLLTACQHAPHFEQGAQTLELMREFIARHTTPQGREPPG
ncbi:MAG: alpha/beta hydrolase [Gammaproteobacteria bacterium]|nr:alpha/beta hydrolase [Gammaproteobacteria bacterium]